MSMRTFHNEKFEGNQYIPQSKQFVDSDPILAQLIDANQQKPEASRGGGNQ